MTNETNDNLNADMYVCLANLLSVASDIQNCFAALEGKRITLEEKMIKTYSNDLIVNIVDYVARSQMIIKSNAFDIEQSVQKELEQLVADMQPVFKELLKTIAYDWNFLEQYYEHDFFGRLANEHRFNERLGSMPLCVIAKTSVAD
ncbi:hypothetical protein KF707_07660 [Candidatus Obscuribacterales bacterium]|nr:hypothetical protein [Candidatus Obscuribacterales bacterium]MBX3136097.1 hypothetical protein [Candidatus Obscuribacterales bacterium]MBX3150087.1 hypothetical protein [Candidatus Obscuribacterales bacterium]